MSNSSHNLCESHSYSRINRVVEGIITSGYPPGDLLELGAGSGALSLRLAQNGFRVTPVDYDPKQFDVRGLQCTQCDLDAAFYFDDSKFDYIVGVEVIEHLENHFYFIRECCRVLKPNGILILTTPNILTLASRFKYFWTGFFALCQRPNNELERKRLYQHINPINYYNLRYILHTNYFHIEKVATDRFRRSSLAFSLFYPLLSLLTASTMRGEPDPRQAEINKDIRRILLSRQLIFGRTLIVIARKVE